MGNKKEDTTTLQDEIIGNAYQELKSLVKKYAEGMQPVLFLGETGSGKEVFSKLFMSSCKKLKGERRTLLCTGVSDDLLNSTIFGHVKGAYTGAHNARSGLIETCQNGILFLDELGDASEGFQAAILRVLENNSYQKLGADEEEQSDALIIAATNRPENIRPEIKFRMSTLYIPPLQKDDIPTLAVHFFQKMSDKLKDKGEAKKEKGAAKKEVFPKENIINKLIVRDYPGNVRELKKVCEELIVEKGKVVFCKKPPSSLRKLTSFNYERYRREIETWNKLLKPLIDKFCPNEFRYEYMPWDPNWLNEKSKKNKSYDKILPAKRLIHCIQEKKRMFSVYAHSTPQLVEWLRRGAHEANSLPPLEEARSWNNHEEEQPDAIKNRKEKVIVDSIKSTPRIQPKDVLPHFRSHMKERFETGILPYLLEQLHDTYSEKTKEHGIYQPSFTHLLDLDLQEAQSEFFLSYYRYHLQQHSDNQRETAKAIGISPSTLRARLKKLKPKK